LREHLAALYVVAFLNVELRDLAERVRADVHVRLWLDLSGGADDARQRIEPALTVTQTSPTTATTINAMMTIFFIRILG
jgi:hypothetical protein